MNKKKINFSFPYLPVLSVLISLLIGAILIAYQGVNPLVAYSHLIQGAMGNLGSFGETIVKTTPLIFTGLGVTFAYRCGVFNIGAEGQLVMGALGGTWFALTFSSLPRFLMLPLCLLSAFLFGAIWGGIPGYLKAKRGLNEIINTIMMNYVAIQFVSWAIKGPLREEGPYPQTPMFSENAWLTRFIPRTRIHTGIIIAVVCAALVYYFLFHTVYGYRIRVVGSNRHAAEYAGINVNLNFVLAMMISGGLAGLAGACDILGIQHRLIDGFASGYGFDGIAVALVSQLNPFGVILTSFLFGALRTGANTMQRAVGIPTSIVDIIQGLIIFFVVAATSLEHANINIPKLRTKKQLVAESKEVA